MATRPSDEWRPIPAQERALRSSAYEQLYGGAAGGGKTDFLLVAPLRWVEHKGFRALLLRRSFPELEKTLLSRSRELYPRLGAKYHEQRHEWTFPSGARIGFGYCERDADALRYQGAEYAFVGFDELTHFSEYTYRYLTSRARSSEGLPIRLRSTTNPGGPGHEWVRTRWGAWLAKPRVAAFGEARWYDADGRECASDAEGALSRTFVPAQLSDNPYLPPEYRAQLAALDPVTRRQLLDGDWDARPSKGLYFPPASWAYLDAAPAGLRRVRAWDFAASPEGDWSVGVLMGRDGAETRTPFVVLDVIRFRGSPADVRAKVLQTAADDGHSVRIVVPQDPGQAGKDQAQQYLRALAGYTVSAKRPTGDKVSRASPLSSQASAGNVALVRGPWCRDFTAELAGFPEWEHDDQVDAAADAFNDLMTAGTGDYAATASDFGAISRRDFYLPDEDDDGTLSRAF